MTGQDRTGDKTVEKTGQGRASQATRRPNRTTCAMDRRREDLLFFPTALAEKMASSSAVTLPETVQMKLLRFDLIKQNT